MGKINRHKQSVLFCISTQKGLSVLQTSFSLLDINILVSTFKEVKVRDSYDAKIKSFAKSNNLPCFEWKTIRDGGVEWLKTNSIWSIVCVGWRYIIPEEWINYLDGRVLVTHDSLLPKYRGFAPLVNAMINGEDQSGVTVMLAGVEMDSGDIVYQRKVPIEPTQNIGDLINAIIPLFVEGIVKSLRAMLVGTLKGEKQDHSKATYSIWRDEFDLQIDWNKSAKEIERTIRALGSPYMGARTKFQGKDVLIGKSKVIPDIPFEFRQPGKVWSLTDTGEPIVVCGDGMLLIEDARIGKESLLPLKKLRVRFY